ncbi:MAG: ZIP family metal transporter [Erysipelotrichaceae bacterium]|nr:ZIP family metal transporter [Erysipelotrichaceae bacterium]
MTQALIMATLGTLFTFFMTSAGAATVYFFKREPSENITRVFLGFAAGVMIAASVWSLLIPAIDMTEEAQRIGWIPAAGGFLIGVFFLLILDSLIPHLHPDSNETEGIETNWKRSTLLVTAVTLHNIPEGMAVGLAFALGVQNGGEYAPAIALALGMGIQNFPEGAAISLPLKHEGKTSTQAFIIGSLSGIVEPIFGIAVVLIAQYITPLMPWLLSFAAGAMIYVTVEELIPEAHLGEHSHFGTLGVIFGFIIMMILDVALG